MATKIAEPEIDYPCSDGKPVAESDIHRDILLKVVERLRARYAGRTDAYASGNLLVYYVQGDPRKSLAPDAFVAFGVPNHFRETYKTWEEGAYPRAVFEFTSRTTRREDLVTKFKIYQDIWKVQEYFLFDPREDYLDPPLQGFRLVRGKFVPVPSIDGAMQCETLGINLSRDGEYFVMTDSITGREVLTDEEQAEVDSRREAAAAKREAAAAKREAAAAKREAAAAKREAVAAKREAADARNDATAERTARVQAEAETAKLEAELAALRNSKTSD